MKTYYSKLANGFFLDTHGVNKPKDCIEIKTEVYNALITAQAEGKIIVADEKGRPISIEVVAIDDKLEEL